MVYSLKAVIYRACQMFLQECSWGQVPLLEFGDGRKLTQSAAITRYFAKKHNLVPKDDFEGALCDEFVDAARDFMKGTTN